MINCHLTTEVMDFESILNTNCQYQTHFRNLIFSNKRLTGSIQQGQMFYSEYAALQGDIWLLLLSKNKPVVQYNDHPNGPILCQFLKSDTFSAFQKVTFFDKLTALTVSMHIAEAILNWLKIHSDLNDILKKAICTHRKCKQKLIRLYQKEETTKIEYENGQMASAKTTKRKEQRLRKEFQKQRVIVKETQSFLTLELSKFINKNRRSLDGALKETYDRLGDQIIHYSSVGNNESVF